MTYFSNKNVITLMRVEKWKNVDWAQIIYNVCVMNYIGGIIMSGKIRGTKRTPIS